MNNTINELNELKQRFEKLYEEKIKDTNTEELIKTCSKYLDYNYVFGETENTQGNIATDINTFVKNTVNIPAANSHTQTLNLTGIIELLNKKVEFLNRN